MEATIAFSVFKVGLTAHRLTAHESSHYRFRHSHCHDAVIGPFRRTIEQREFRGLDVVAVKFVGRPDGIASDSPQKAGISLKRSLLFFLGHLAFQFASTHVACALAENFLHFLFMFCHKDSFFLPIVTKIAFVNWDKKTYNNNVRFTITIYSQEI